MAALAKGAGDPSGAVIIGQQCGDRNTVAIKPFAGLRIERMEALGVVEEPLEDQTKSPHHQEDQECKDCDGDNNRDDDGQ